MTAVAVLGCGLVVAAPAAAADTDIRINEVQSTSETDAPDFVELTNVGAEPIDISGWILRDDKDDHGGAVADGTTIAPGEFFVIEPKSFEDDFGLGKNDMARLFTAEEQLVDSYEWTEHAASEGRLPDGTGDFVETEPTPGEANVVREEEQDEPDEPSDAPVVINEIESNGDARGDWVELANTDENDSVDVSGWTLIDNKASHDPVVLDEGTEIESGGYLGVLTEPNFGLGGGDSVTVRDAEGLLVDAIEWTEHASTTLARCPDMTGDFTESGEGTFELANNCSEVVQPEIEVSPWPYNDEVTDAVASGTWGDDMSGIDVAPDGTVYAVNNDAGEISRLAGGPETYTVDATWQPSYPDGTGTPDGEGITVADDAIYLATERNNDEGDVSRPSVLRFELGEPGAVAATDEWNLAELTGELGANGGAEAIEWISDADALAAGLDYDPSAFGEHFGGIFTVGIEQTGSIHVVVLEADGGITELQMIAPSEAVASVMGLDWRAGGNQLFAQCDEECDNRSAEFRIADGAFERIDEYAAPAGMNPSYTNEGVAMTWCDQAAETVPTVLWMSDSAHEGVSLRTSVGSDCAPDGDGDGDDGNDDEGGDEDGGDADSEQDGAVSVQASAERGETISVTVVGREGEEVAVWLHSEPQRLVTGTVAADATIKATIPDDAELGEHSIVVRAADGTTIGSAPIEIVAASDADGELAVTGAEFSPVLPIAAAALLLLGGALVLRRTVRA
ncbi:lamin tail domain-containing protein [Microbacterium halotolerans]|uniref:lamin tail domain-containing protein n=1 Tax=Microbacterium halotolerans TaxID=246613 RepID=UPI0013C2FF3B|nr:lamin tail domain-containing protein [Microbacterium halotolerans]